MTVERSHQLATVLDGGGQHAHGRWVGLSHDGVIGGHATLARTREQAQAAMTRLLDDAKTRA